MSGENRTDIEKELQEVAVKKMTDEETALSKMSPAQKERLEKLKAIYEDKIAKMRFKTNLKTMAQQKSAAKRKKAEKVNKKRNKASRGHK